MRNKLQNLINNDMKTVEVDKLIAGLEWEKRRGHYSTDERMALLSELKAMKKALNIDLVMLSEILEEADKEATKLDDGKSDHSLGTSQGFESGADWVIERIKEKLHSA